MINTSELRRDNIVGFTIHDKIIPCPVIEITEKSIYVEYRGLPMLIFEKDADPIPVSQKWLLKFDFIKQDVGKETFFMSPIAAGGILFGYRDANPSECSLFQWKQEMPLAACQIQYVHQLQNLFYAISTRELTIKP